MTTTTTTREVDGFDLRDGMRLLGADDHVWILSNVYHSPNLGNGVHEATATREDNPSQSWPVRLSNIQARAARYVEVTP